jgi:tyrosinase
MSPLQLSLKTELTNSKQTLYARMAKIAEDYPEHVRPKYRAALKDFRLPYWDYYKPRNKRTTKMPGITGPRGTTSFDYDFALPQIFTVESVMIRRTSDDQLDSLQNPLNRFVFPSSGGLSEADWTLASGFSKKQTVRYPSNINDVKGDPTSMNTTLNRDREGNAIMILDMIKDYNSFASFSSDSLTPGASGSLEDIHGNYHGLIGGPRGRMGHMSRVPIAAFDPVFWMHHW